MDQLFSSASLTLAGERWSLYLSLQTKTEIQTPGYGQAATGYAANMGQSDDLDDSTDFVSVARGRAELERTDLNFAERDFNAEYQTLLETRFESEEEELERVRRLGALSEEFARIASAIGTTIISERFMKASERSIEVIQRLGLGGGEKYIHEKQNIFFKLCVDSNNLYGGDEFASKAGGNELKGIMEYSDCKLGQLRFPLVVMIDYLGCRLLAEPMLPISRTTLVYGSSDGGESIRSSDEEVNRLMARAARELNLTTHEMMTFSKSSTHQMSSCLDIEVHRSARDGRMYLLDAARAMPPTTPTPGVRGCNLFRLMRPELVRAFHTPLCPDAYGGWPLQNRSVLQQSIDDATFHLLQVICPEFVVSLVASRQHEAEAEQEPRGSLSAAAHRRGINIRYLGYCAKLASGQCEDTRRHLVTEVVARTVKNVLRLRMRKLASSAPESYHGVLLNGLNDLLTSQTQSYWGLDFKRSVEKRFPGTMTADEISDSDFDIRMHTDPKLLFERLVAMLSLQLTERAKFKAMQLFYPTLRKLSDLDFSPQVSWDYWRRCEQDQVILEHDIVALIPRVKTLNVLPYESGNVYSKSNQFEAAYKCYQQSVEIKPADLRALHNWGISYTLNAEALASKGNIQQAKALFSRAEAKYRVCISVNSRDWVALYLWGNLCVSRYLVFEQQVEKSVGQVAALLGEAKERFESAWMALGGAGDASVERTRELLYSWGLAHLLEALSCSASSRRVEADSSYRAAAAKFRECIKMAVPPLINDAANLDFRVRFNLGIALSRSNDLQAAENVWGELAVTHANAVLFGEWSFVLFRKIASAWGRLGEGYQSSFAFETNVLRSIELWCKAIDCGAGDYLGKILAQWGQLLILWSEIRFKRYGLHSRQGSLKMSRSELEESDEEESSSESSSEEDVAEDVVSEDVYIFNVDFYLHVFVVSNVSLTTLAPLGAAKESILSSHTIQRLLMLAQSAPSRGRQCERALNAIISLGGNHKLKLDSSVTTELSPELASRLNATCFGLKVSSMGTEFQGLEYENLMHGKTLN